MRIYNGTDSSITLPLIGNQFLTIQPHSVSENFVGTTEFLSLLVTSYTTKELAFVVGGPFELSLCARIPVATNYVVQSLDEAIEKFAKIDEEKKLKKLKEEKKKKKEEEDSAAKKAEEVKDEVEEKKDEGVVENVEVEVKPEKKSTKSTTRKKKNS